jgi:hypothetical protein
MGAGGDSWALSATASANPITKRLNSDITMKSDC